MKLSEEIKNKIIGEYSSFKDKQYGSKSLEERRERDQFFTPASISIQMIESFSCDSLQDKTILDPTCGSGNLLAACIIAGAQPKNIYGNEFDLEILKLCRQRLDALCKNLGLPLVPEQNLHQGDALKDDCLSSESFQRGVVKDNNFRNNLFGF